MPQLKLQHHYLKAKWKHQPSNSNINKISAVTKLNVVEWDRMASGQMNSLRQANMHIVKVLTFAGVQCVWGQGCLMAWKTVKQEALLLSVEVTGCDPVLTT